MAKEGESKRLASAFDSSTFGKDGSFRLDEPVGSASISPCGRDVVLASYVSRFFERLSSNRQQASGLAYYRPRLSILTPKASSSSNTMGSSRCSMVAFRSSGLLGGEHFKSESPSVESGNDVFASIY